VLFAKSVFGGIDLVILTVFNTAILPSWLPFHGLAAFVIKRFFKILPKSCPN
jgi:hypothetical protein